ncbi:metal ABC transporter substrate-binding protein [Ghiorsea bivora]|uniref:metal ABC transporter substrate-binding protein n=1 Tax=Ghiorsea bivora TaxID=1485545 RepID=UPI0005708C9E|nr:metal ABC transporter substrate-binding protein [Ghiorsea bivora]
MKYLQKLLILTITLILAQTTAMAGDLRIVASLPALGQIAQGVAGDFAEVKVLAHVGQDPHFVPPKPTLARHLARADLLIAAGLGLEIGWLPPLVDASRNDNIRQGSQGYLDGRSILTKVLGKPHGKITRELGDIHPEGNPHWWMDPLNGVRLAEIIAERLSKLDPTHAEVYRKRASKFTEQIKQRMPQWKISFQELSPLVAYHNSYLYLTRRFGLQVIDYVEPKPGIEPSTFHLDALVSNVQQNDVQGVWLEPYHDGPIARKLCELTHTSCRLMPDAVKGEGFEAYISMFDLLASGGE